MGDLTKGLLFICNNCYCSDRLLDGLGVDLVSWFDVAGAAGSDEDRGLDGLKTNAGRWICCWRADRVAHHRPMKVGHALLPMGRAR
ncbi:hypothetical protein ACLOJK_019019 [Asimina triloba]